jgi:hypothetical protein
MKKVILLIIVLALAGISFAQRAGTICNSCPKPELEVTYDTVCTKAKGKSPFGSTQLRNPPYDISVEGGCQKCKDNVCCCLITKIKVKIHFTIAINSERIDKGVWFNTSDDKKKLGQVKEQKDEPKPNKDGEWKKVDEESVRVHEDKHCKDITEKMKERLQNIISKSNVYLPLPCNGKECNKEEENCRKTLDKSKQNIENRFGENIKDEMDELHSKENIETKYPTGELEQAAREAQAKYLKEKSG